MRSKFFEAISSEAKFKHVRIKMKFKQRNFENLEKFATVGKESKRCQSLQPSFMERKGKEKQDLGSIKRKHSLDRRTDC